MLNDMIQCSSCLVWISLKSFVSNLRVQDDAIQLLGNRIMQFSCQILPFLQSCQCPGLLVERRILQGYSSLVSKGESEISMVLCIEVWGVVGHSQQANAALVGNQWNSHPGTVYSQYKLRVCAQMPLNTLRPSFIHRQIVNNERFVLLGHLSMLRPSLQKLCQSFHHRCSKDALVG